MKKPMTSKAPAGHLEDANSIKMGPPGKTVTAKIAGRQLAADRSTKTDEANAKAKAKPVAPPSPEEEPVVHAAFEQGRAARRARIARDDAPHGDGPALDAWRKGYDHEEKTVG